MATNIGILVLLIVASSLAATPHTTQAAKHVVPWIIPTTQDSSFYSNLLANTTFNLNDILVFNYTTGSHNVVTLSKDDFKDCSVKNKMETFEVGPTMIKLNRTGEYYFACAFPAHCSLGQKLSVNVMASSSSPEAAPAVAPSSPASRLSVAATFSVLLMLIAINILF